MNTKVTKKIFSIRPYIRLLRLNNMTGTMLLLWPCVWSITLASSDSFPFGLLFLFTVGAILMRSSGCIINDIIDRKYDRKVERTKNRPLAKGEIRLSEAILIMTLLLMIAGIILFSLNQTTIVLGLTILVPIFLYPLTKRITYWPQVFLAFTFNWGALMGWTAVRGTVDIEAIIIYTACFFWTICYDTIYAHQDKKDDLLLGLKSSAIRLGHNTKQYLVLFYSITIFCLWVTGIMLKLGMSYYVFLCMAISLLIWQIVTLDINDSKDCMQKFVSSRYFGLLIFLGIISGKYIF